MIRETGITIEHNIDGQPVLAHIDLRKYGRELSEFFRSKGIVVEQSPYDKNFVDKVKQGQYQIANGDFKVVETGDLWK